MITKNDYCQHILQEFAHTQGLKVEEIEDVHILSSSTLAVAMEYLGLLKEADMIAYANSRSGIHALTLDGKHLSTREFLALLPEVL